MRVRAGIAFLLALVVGLPAYGETRLKALRSRGDLIGWEAVGRVDTGRGGFCTGALVAPDLVLTAAHCVFDNQTGAQKPPERLGFRAGYVDGDALASRTVDRVVVDSGYRHSTGGLIAGKMMLHDVALLRLASPISTSEADPFAIYAEPKPGEKVSVLSYGQGRSEHLSWQRDCSVVGRGRGVMSFDCDVTFGSSGAPVFARYGTRVRILSLISAMGTDAKGRKVSFGMELPPVVAELKRRMRNGDTVGLRSGEGARRIKAGTRARKGPSGAKFLRVN